MLSNSRAAHCEHDHQRCIDAAIHKASTLCEERSARFTENRETVLRLIWQSHRPLGAYDLVEQLSVQTGKRVLAPTVYRAIDFLLNMGLIHRIASLNAYMGCPFPGSAHSDLFLICTRCGCAAECSAEGINRVISDTAVRASFQLASQFVEVLGLCPTCQTES